MIPFFRTLCLMIKNIHFKGDLTDVSGKQKNTTDKSPRLNWISKMKRFSVSNQYPSTNETDIRPQKDYEKAGWKDSLTNIFSTNKWTLLEIAYMTYRSNLSKKWCSLVCWYPSIMDIHTSRAAWRNTGSGRIRLGTWLTTGSSRNTTRSLLKQKHVRIAAVPASPATRTRSRSSSKWSQIGIAKSSGNSSLSGYRNFCTAVFSSRTAKFVTSSLLYTSASQSRFRWSCDGTYHVQPQTVEVAPRALKHRKVHNSAK